MMLSSRFLFLSSHRSIAPVFGGALMPRYACSARWYSNEVADAVAGHAKDDDHRVLKREVSDGVLSLTLNRPKQRNSLNRELLESFRDELEMASKSPQEVRAIVVQAEGQVFSSGHDLKELVSLDERGQTEIFQLCSDVMQLLPGIPQPTICAVKGLATAAGCQLVAACDIVVANPRSLYSTPGATSIGLFCHTPAVPLARSIGVKRALDMLYTGRVITAQEALAYGLVTRIAGNPHVEADKIAKQISMQSVLAIQPGKKIFYQQTDTPSLNEAYKLATKAIVENMQTKDANRGIGAFLEKKEIPDWNHE